MKRHLLVALAAVLAVGISASAARAQCAFQHPKKGSKLQSSIIQAFVSCNNPGGNNPNNTTAGGIPACSPPETFSQQAGNCGNGGWVWIPAVGPDAGDIAATGSVKFTAKKICTEHGGPAEGGVIQQPACSPTDPLNSGGTCQGGTNNGAACVSASECPGAINGCSPHAVDLDVVFKLAKIRDCGTGDLVNGTTGTLATLSRATLNDNKNGDETVIDFSAQFGFTMTDGAAKLRTSADAVLNSIGNAGLPPCTAIEVVAIRVLDANNDAFGNIGTYLPEL